MAFGCNPSCSCVKESSGEAGGEQKESSGAAVSSAGGDGGTEGGGDTGRRRVTACVAGVLSVESRLGDALCCGFAAIACCCLVHVLHHGSARSGSVHRSGSSSRLTTSVKHASQTE